MYSNGSIIGQRSLTRTTTGAIAILIACIFSSAAAELCSGQARNEHDRGDYKFVTNSKVYRGHNVEIYETCIGNLSERDTEFDWFIPGPNTWLPPLEQAFSKRTFDSRDTLNGAASCMEFGNLSTTDRFTFLGHELDKFALDRENSESCSKWVSQDRVDAGDEAPGDYNVTVAIRVFIPTDKNEPEETMMLFQGEASLFHKQGEPVTTQFTYEFVPYKGRSGGDPTKVSMRPADIGPAGEILRAAFSKTFGGKINVERGMPLTSSDKYFLQYPTKSNFKLTSTRYGFYDQNDQYVGAIFVPVLAPMGLK